MSDAGRYRRVHVNEWLDPAFRRLDAAHRVVRLYVSAGPQTTSVGCFRLSTAMAVEELGGTPEEFERCLANVCEAFSWAWDPVARVIWIADWFERNPPANKNVVAAWVKLIKNVPNSEVKSRAISSIDESLKTLYPGFRQPWAELLKSFRRAESQAESRAEPPQGTGSFVSGKTESRRAPRGSAGADEKGAVRTTEPSDERLVQLARKTTEFTSVRRATDEWLDAFKETCRQHGVNPENFKTADVTRVLEDLRATA